MASMRTVVVVVFVSLFCVESIVRAGCPPRPGVAGLVVAPVAPTPAEIAKIKAAFTSHVVDNSSENRGKAKAWATALSTQGAWPDINYKDECRGCWQAMQHVERCAAISQALPADKGLLAPLVSAVNFWLDNDFKNPNWWYATIGIPVEYATIMLLIDAAGHHDALDPAQRAKVLALMERSGYAESTQWTGANLADVMKSQIARGLLFGNCTAVTTGFARVWAELYVSHWCDDNIQADGSFHQHSDEGVRGALLAGSYGTVFTSDMLGFVDLAAGTSLELGRAGAAVLTSLLLDGQRWMITPDNQWDWSVVGRGNSGGPSEFSVGDFGGNGKYLTELEVPTRTAELEQFAACLGGAPAACEHKVGNRHFWDSDYHVHRRPGWMATVRMYSVRTIAARCVNAQGKRNSHEADGVTNLYIKNGSYPYEGIFPIWDFHEVAGMSSEIDVPLLPCNGADAYNEWPAAMNYTRWVGGVSDGTLGAAAMNLSSGTLNVHNTWSFGATAYVHLGAGLDCSSSSPVTTSLANQMLGDGEVWVGLIAGGAPMLLKSGNHSFRPGLIRWVWHGCRIGDGSKCSGTGIAYIPLQTGATINVSNTDRTGSWSSLGTGHGTVTAATLQVLLDHGTCADLDKSTFGYAIVPTVTLKGVAQLLASPPWEVRANTPALQAVAWTTLLPPPAGADAPSAAAKSAPTSLIIAAAGRPETESTVQAVFWQPSARDTREHYGPAPAAPVLACSAPAVVMARHGAGGLMNITASSPLAEVRVVVITVQGTFQGQHCAASATANTTDFTVSLGANDYLGQSTTVVCEPTRSSGQNDH